MNPPSTPSDLKRRSDPAPGFLSLPLPHIGTPREALARLGELPGRVLLESAGSEAGWSILAADPIALLRIGGGESRLTAAETRLGAPATWEGSFPDPFTALDCLMRGVRTATPPEGIPFAGGVIGFLGYEAGDHLERLPQPPPDDLGVPEGWFGVYDAAILWAAPGSAPRAVASILPGRSEQETRGRLEGLIGALVHGPAPLPSSLGVGADKTVPGEAVTSLSREAFMEGVDRIRACIRRGDLFQANLTRRISLPTGRSGVELYDALLHESPAPYAAYLDFGEGEVASISPEGFLSLRGKRVRTAPIKGTRPRGKTPEADAALRRALAESAKDRAENVMIVDLLRNDLSRVSIPGSVAVPNLAEVESHPTVHHLVSTVTGLLTPEAGPIDLLRAAFPGGSVTGAPKIRAMELLRSLEPVRRGVYTGALGILGFHGDLELSVAIRTALLRGGRVYYGTGGGITLDSDPEAEWRESEDKATALYRALGRGDE